MTKLQLTTAMIGLAITVVTAAAPSRVRAQDSERARKLFEEAFNRRYRWSETLKGFSAGFSVTSEGKKVSGSVKADLAKPHGGVEVTCEDEQVKKMVQETIASTITHTRSVTFDQAFGNCQFSIASDGVHGGTKITLSGHPFFKDFTVKDGNIVENHGARGEMASEVEVQQVVWLAICGKTLPRAYAFKIKTASGEHTGRTTETWHEVDGVWLPARYRLVRNNGGTPEENMLELDNIKVEQGTH